MNELLNKSTGITIALMTKIISGIVLTVLIYSAISIRISVVESNQQRRMDANVIANVALLKAKDEANEKRFTAIENETNDYKESKQMFKEMSEDLKEIKKILMK